MAEIESNKYGPESRDKKIAGAGRFNQPTQFHPDRLSEHKRDLKRKAKKTPK